MKKEELEAIANAEISKLGIDKLSAEEMSEILISNSSNEVIRKAYLICEKRSLAANTSNDLSSVFQQIVTFVYSHPLEILLVGITVRIFCPSLYNFPKSQSINRQGSCFRKFLI
jgi:hypothetical protein